MIPPEDKCEVQDLGTERNFFTIMPNILIHYKLDPWAFKAYYVIKMTAGDKGACFKSNSRMAEEVGCSVPTLIKLKKELAEHGLIIIKKRVHANGGNMPDLIQVVDIWGQNMEYMLKLYPKNPENDHFMMRGKTKKSLSQGGKPGLVGGVNTVNQGGKPDLHKQDIKEEKQKEQQQHAAETAAVFSKSSSQQEQQATPLSSSFLQHNINTQTLPDNSKIELTKQNSELNKSFCNKPYQPSGNSGQLKIYSDLKDIEIPEQEKIEITRRNSESVVKNAIAWATHPKNPPKKCLAASIKYACKHKYSADEFTDAKKKLSAFEQVKQYFKHGEFYNNAECFVTNQYIAFQRGMRNESVPLDTFFSWNKLQGLCSNFQITIPGAA